MKRVKVREGSGRGKSEINAWGWMQLGRFKEETRPVWLEWQKTKGERQSRVWGGFWVYSTYHRKLRENLCFKKIIQDFPDGTVDKNSPAKTWVWSLVWGDSTCCRQPKACMPQLLQPVCCNELKPVCLSSVTCALHKRSHHNETPEHCSKEEPLLTATRQSLRTATNTQPRQNKKINNFF